LLPNRFGALVYYVFEIAVNARSSIFLDAPKTLSVPIAGKQYFDLGRGAAYAAAASGEIPTIRIGRKLRVPIAALERMLERVGKGDAA
jgi:Helix-turn-helix domain